MSLMWLLILLGSLCHLGNAFPNIPLQMLQNRLEAETMEHLPGLVFRVNPNVADVINDEKTRHYLAKSLKTTVFDNFTFKVLQMNLSIDGLVVKHVDIDEIRVTPISRHSFQLIINAASVRVAGSYRGIYRTIREGTVKAILKDITVTATISLPLTAKPSESISIIDCATNINDPTVAFEPSLIEQANAKLTDILKTYVQSRVCAGIEHFFHADKLQNALSDMPLALKTNTMKAKMNSELVLRPVIDDGSLYVALNGTFGSDPVFEKERKRVQIAKTDTTSNVYAYISDYLLNSYLRERTHDKKLKLKLTDSVKKILISDCDDGNCIGSFIERPSFTADFNSPEVVVAFGSAPKIEFTSDGARMTLDVTAQVSYDEIAERQAVFDVSAIMVVLIKKFDLLFENHDTELQLDLTLEKIDLIGSKVKLPSGDAFMLSEVIEKVVTMDNAAYIEDLIITNVPRLMPVFMSNKLHATAIRGFFRPNTLVLTANVTPKTLKYFL